MYMTRVLFHILCATFMCVVGFINVVFAEWSSVKLNSIKNDNPPIPFEIIETSQDFPIVSHDVLYGATLPFNRNAHAMISIRSIILNQNDEIEVGVYNATKKMGVLFTKDSALCLHDNDTPIAIPYPERDNVIEITLGTRQNRSVIDINAQHVCSFNYTFSVNMPSAKVIVRDKSNHTASIEVGQSIYRISP